MRILLATDGSSRSRRARDLLASLAIPPRSTIRVITVLHMPTSAGLSTAARAQLVGAALGATEAELEEFAAPLRRSGLAVTVAALAGRSATAIIDEARRTRADLIVVGSHGRGPLATAILGSVAAEVVDHAPCPVLVARTTRVARAVVAEDGSPGAAAARRALTRHRLFRGVSAKVVSVVQPHPPLASGLTAGVREAAQRAYATDAAKDRLAHRRSAERAARQLHAAGIKAIPVVALGDPATEILELVRGSRADLVVIGTRGLSDIARILLGSVARRVLQRSASSVLIAHARG